MKIKANNDTPEIAMSDNRYDSIDDWVNSKKISGKYPAMILPNIPDKSMIAKLKLNKYVRSFFVEFLIINGATATL